MASPVREREQVATLESWDLIVESWDAGDDEILEEDRGLGYVTREVRPTTAVSELEAGRGPLRSWHEIDEVGPEVSGVGEYAATIELAEAPGEGECWWLDLGSTAGGLGSVSVNGSAPRGFDTSAPRVDVTDALVAGRNDVRVRVSSSLNNRLIARGYYDAYPDFGALSGGAPPRPHETTVREYGLLGPVVLRRQRP